MNVVPSTYCLRGNQMSKDNIVITINKDDLARMKSNVMFRDQLNNVTSLFDQWNECEQAVAVCCLLHKLGAIQARFLALVLDHSLSGCAEALKIQEQEANDPGYIHSLRNKTKDDALVHLLSHLPLLQPGNEDAKREYLGLITKIITHSVRNGIHLEESRQLLSYCLLHPAVSTEDRRALSIWLPHLDDHVNSPLYMNCHLNGSTQDGAAVLNGSVIADRYLNRPYGSESRLETWQNNGLNLTESPGAVVNGNGSYGDLNCYSALNGLGSNSLPPGIGANHMSLHAINSCPPAGLSSISSQGGNQQVSFPHCRIRRSNSLTPPSGTTLQSNLQLHRHHSQNHGHNDWALADNGALMHSKSQQAFSLDHAPLSPQSSVASSGSSGECHVEDSKSSFNVDGSGMKDVPLWLKGLRLHKYSYLFANMSYEDMMDLTEAKLEAMNVTKGARRKIYLSIQKLKDRQNTLKSLEKEIENGGNIRNALTELKSMIQTPMKRYTSSFDNGDSSSSSEESADNVEPLPDSSDLAQLSSSPQANGIASSEIDANSAVAEGDLPGQFTRLMGKICTNLLVSPSQPDDENRNLFLMLIDKCLGHEVFTPTQKRRLFSWKQQVQKVWHPLPPRRTLENRLSRGKWSGPHNGTNGSLGQGIEFNSMAAAGSVANRWHPSQQQQQQQQQFSQPPAALQATQQRAVHPRQQGLLASHLSSQQRNSHVVKRPSLQDHLKPHIPVQRTHSAPVRPNPPSSSSSLFGKPGEDNSVDPEINTRLESLCLSVTEHAIGGLDGASPY